MKPDWDDAPEWASYLVVDDGKWMWCHCKPYYSDNHVAWLGAGKSEYVIPEIEDWNSLEARP